MKDEIFLTWADAGIVLIWLDYLSRKHRLYGRCAEDVFIFYILMDFQLESDLIDDEEEQWTESEDETESLIDMALEMEAEA